MKELLIFKTSKNFKRGLFIMNRYRLSDLVIILSTVVISILSIILYLNLTNQPEMLIKFMVVVALLLPVLTVYLLFMPMPTYFNILDFLKVWIKWKFKQKLWLWEGIHQFDNYEEGEQYEKSNKKIYRKKKFKAQS